MSRNIVQRDGKVIETIESMEDCQYLWNEMCCDDRSGYFTYCPKEHCKKCSLFTKEDGIIEKDRGKK